MGTPVMNAQSGAEYLLGEDAGVARMQGNFGDHAEVNESQTHSPDEVVFDTSEAQRL
jgi:hypothetical protein